MANTIRIKRRAASGNAGAPTTLENAELAFNEADETLYIGVGTGGENGSATSVAAIGGPGSFLPTTTTRVKNTILAGPTTGSDATPDFRALVADDIPDISATYLALVGGTVSGNVVISGDFQVDGTTTTVNSTTVQIDDKNLELGTVADPDDSGADGGGITLKGTSDKTIQWLDATDAWTFSDHIDLADGKSFYIDGTNVLSGSALGGGVTTSSLTSVGTVDTGTWQGTAVADAYVASSATWNAKQNALTFGIADTNTVRIDDADADDDDYAKFTSSGIEGRSASEVKTDLSLGNVENTAVSTWVGTTNITTLGTIGAGAWQGTEISVAHGGTGVTTITGLIKGDGTNAFAAATAGVDYMAADGSIEGGSF